MIDLDAILLRRCDEQCAEVGIPADGHDGWAIRGARRKPGPKGALSDDEVRRIRQALSDGETQGKVAERFGVSRPVINAIACRRAYRRVA